MTIFVESAKKRKETAAIIDESASEKKSRREKGETLSPTTSPSAGKRDKKSDRKRVSSEGFKYRAQMTLKT